MNDYIVVTFSGGKDSTAMLLRMIELGEHIDEVICCDTTKEFPAMYRHIKKVKKVVEAAGIKFTVLRAEKDFDHLMFDHVVQPRDGSAPKNGYSWAGTRSRWCTSKLKVDVVDRYFGTLNECYNVIQCNGIAADEQYRLERTSNQQENKRFPLVEWGWSEADCLKYCYDHGYDWEGLYEIFERVSCWCCPLQGLEGLRSLRKHFPDLWQELRDMDKRTWRRFRADYSVEELEIRFQLEEEMAAKGLPTSGRTKIFREALKERLGEYRNGIQDR